MRASPGGVATGAVALLVVTLASTPGAAQPADRPLVLLASDTAPDPLVDRLHDELVAMGLRVETRPATSDTAALRAFGRERGAAAVVQVSHGPRATRVWTGPDAEEPTRIGGRGDDATDALAAAEVIRAHLVEPQAEAATEAETEAEPPGPATPAEGEATPPEEPEPVLDAWLGPAVLLSPGGVPAQLAGSVGVDWHALGAGYVEVLADVALGGVSVDDLRTTASVWTGLFGAGVGYAPLSSRSSVDLRASVGVAALVLVLREDNRRETRAAAVPYARIAGAYRFTPAVALQLAGTLGLALPLPELRLRAGAQLRYGRPLATVALSLLLSV